MKQFNIRLLTLLLCVVSWSASLPVFAQDAVRHTLSVVANPTIAGTFNTDNAELEAGETIQLLAYAKSNFSFKEWQDSEGNVIARTPEFEYTMPDRDVTLTATYEYNPANPENPVKNYWDAVTGVAIVDDFKAGSLSSAVSTAIKGSKTTDLLSLTVAGQMTQNDYSVINSYANCAVFDISRVTGVTEVPSYAFDYTKVESVYLPASIEKIGYRAFYQCKQLTSLTVYAMVPPAIDSSVFSGIQEGLIVYVPAAAIAQYQDDANWQKFTILPVQDDVRNLTVSLPEGATAADFAQMWLELTNTKSGQKLHYVLTDRTSYTFANIIRNTSWNAVLRNQRGDVFGRIDGIEVKNEDVNVTFSQLSRPQNVSVAVMTPEGRDVTTQTQITWVDAEGNYLAQSNSLSGLPAGYTASYRVALPQDLAMQFVTPEQTECVVNETNNRILCQLVSIPQVTLTGQVKDLTTKTALRNANVSASQTFGGRYSKTVSTKTDANGCYSLAVSSVPTSLTVSAFDYISQTIVCDTLMTGAEMAGVPDVSLKGITGAVITLNLTYTKCPTGAEDEETFQEWYSDYNNVGYSIYNRTKQCAISQYNVQYPQIVLLEEVSEGDELELMATSKTGAFMPIVTTATIEAEQRANAAFNIVELGKIQATFVQNSNASVVGILYDAKGKLVKSYDYTNASLTVSNLADGSYTLVSMGGSPLFNSIYDLRQLPQTGLVRGSDYVQQSVEVKSGQVTNITIDNVPTLNESALYYTGDNTSFTVNKPSIVAGNYLTLTGNIDFKSAYKDEVSNVNLIVDLPESCSFVEGSVMVGNNTSSYTLQDNRVTIPMAQYTDRVRFCIIPTLGGDYAPSALCQFDIDGESVTQPIGSANYQVKDLSIRVPSTVAKTTVPISGTSIGKSIVEIYDNGDFVGRTVSLPNGCWSTNIELNDPYNLSKHNIFAKVTTTSGLQLLSETKCVVYDMNAVQVSKITMYHWNPEMSKMFESVFDFMNPSAKPNQWTVYYPKKKFTYTIEFTNNSPEIIYNVILYVHAADGSIIPLQPQYDSLKDLWVAEIDMGNRPDNYYPVNCSISYDCKYIPQVDNEKYNNSVNYLSVCKEKWEQIENDLDRVAARIEEALDNDPNSDLLSELLLEYRSISGAGESLNEFNLDGISEDDAMVYFETLSSDIDTLLNLNPLKHFEEIYTKDLYSQFNDIDGITISKCEGISIEYLLSLGYTEIPKTNQSSLYILTTDSCYNLVDFNNSVFISIDLSAISRNKNLSKASPIDDFIIEMNNYLTNAQGYWRTLSDIFNRVGNLIDEITTTVSEKTAANILKLDQTDYYINWLKKQPFKEKDKWKSQLRKLNRQQEDLHKSIARNKQILEWINHNLSPERLRIGKIGGGLSAIVDVGLIIYDATTNFQEIMRMYSAIPEICRDDQNAADNLRNRIRTTGITAGVYYVAQLASDVVQISSLLAGVSAIIPSCGTSMGLVVGSLSLAVANYIACQAYEIILKNRINEHHADLLSLRCIKDCGKPGMPPCPPPPGGNGGSGGGSGNGGAGGASGSGSGSPNDEVHIDPSGFVYEGVFSNRLSGVTATCFYKEMIEDMYGDLHENIVKWNAEEYAQENPLFTDENGFYRWDVPQGLWQVKFEKEGYETTYSEWLPVPPPQLDVNIAMTQVRQPEVKSARAYEDAVEVEFDKYMIPATLTEDNIYVIANGKKVEGTILLLNEEVAYEGKAEKYASKIRFNANAPFAAKEVTLTVANRVKSYAGIQMQESFSQTFDVEQEVKSIETEANITVTYDGDYLLTVKAMPAAAAAGKTLLVRSSSSMIATTDAGSYVLDKKGEAQVLISGELPGTTGITFTIDGYDLSVTTMVNVKMPVATDVVATPTASIASGTTVERGTKVVLSCETPDATIYYTLDGSCPCDEDSRLVYTAPIVINESVTIKAMAVAPDMEDSEIAEFSYIVTPIVGIDEVTLDETIKVYPLPVRDKLNVTAGGELIKSVTLVSTNGSVVAKAAKPETIVTLDVSTLTPGIYFINVATEDKKYSRKIMKVE